MSERAKQLGKKIAELRLLMNAHFPEGYKAGELSNLWLKRSEVEKLTTVHAFKSITNDISNTINDMVQLTVETEGWTDRVRERMGRRDADRSVTNISTWQATEIMIAAGVIPQELAERLSALNDARNSLNHGLETLKQIDQIGEQLALLERNAIGALVRYRDWAALVLEQKLARPELEEIQAKVAENRRERRDARKPKPELSAVAQAFQRAQTSRPAPGQAGRSLPTHRRPQQDDQQIAV